MLPKNSAWVGTRIAVALRWLIRRLGVKRIGFVVLSEYEGVASPVRPSSGDALAIDWSVWIGFGSHWRGYGSVRTWARVDDLEIWIAGAGPFTSVEGRIDLHPPIKRPAAEFKSVKVRNSAPNPRLASGHIQLRLSIPGHGIVGGFDFSFVSLRTGESGRVQMRGSTMNFAEPRIEFSVDKNPTAEVEVSTLLFKTQPVGAARVERLYGVPEWMAAEAQKEN
jgi:hypothetical protein